MIELRFIADTDKTIDQITKIINKYQKTDCEFIKKNGLQYVFFVDDNFDANSFKSKEYILNYII